MEVQSRGNKSSSFILKVVLGILALLLLLSLLMCFYLKNKGAPEYGGTKSLKGLSSPTKVTFDKNGIPHISAETDLDAFRVLGYTMASDRLFQFDLFRRLAKGRLAELFGEKAIPADKVFRTLRLYQQFSNQKSRPEIEAIMEAFIAGVNEFVAEGRFPFEYTLLGADVEPFSREDGFGVLGYMAYSFAMGLKTDPLMEGLSTKFGPEKINELRREPLSGTSERVVRDVPELEQSLWKKGHDFVSQTVGLISGSNAWALSSSRSVDGPLLASDPHVAFGIPGLWYEAHVKWKKGLSRDNFEFYGHFVPLLPFPAMAHTDRHAWAVTISYIDDMDFFWEELSGGQYISEKGPLDFKVHREEIKVKGKDPVVLEVKTTATGPLVDHLFENFDVKYPQTDKETKYGVSLKWGHHDKENRAAESFYGALMAKNRGEFEKALSYGRSPGLNVVYADKEGNISRYLFGTYWKRKTGDSGDRFRKRPLSSQAMDHYENLPFEERPHLINPGEGFVVSANQKPENTASLTAGYFQPDDRYMTIRELLQVKPKWSLEELKVLQTADNNIFFGVYRDTILEALKEAGELEGDRFLSAKELLKSWELNSPANSSAALLFYTFFNDFQRRLLEGMKEEEFNLYCDTNYLYHYTKRELLGGHKNKLIRDSFKSAVTHLRKKYGPVSQWQLSQEQTLTLGHPLSRASKVLAKVLDVGPLKVDGGYNQINNMRPVGCRNGMSVKAGPSTRRLISLKDTSYSYGVLPLGNSGHYGSPFFKNQVNIFFKNDYRAQIMRELRDDEVFSVKEFKPL